MPTVDRGLLECILDNITVPIITRVVLILCSCIYCSIYIVSEKGENIHII